MPNDTTRHDRQDDTTGRIADNQIFGLLTDDVVNPRWRNRDAQGKAWSEQPPAECADQDR
ncbi:hypothetical protein BN2475_1290019 [Paraburkholderia ribeironis]|uniref:Uncharacterized protein n=1 Tax=Paraburkholderia ribeironis TaxID=1247936 RepID=A0A1N7SP28_9BURK|nr:hypothetical protein BN2475_1290019 [Paraburkholderia ribeironis]